MRIRESAYLPPGQMAMERDGQIVWTGPVGSPIADAVFDCLVMHPDDVATLMRKVDAYNARAGIIRTLGKSTP